MTSDAQRPAIVVTPASTSGWEYVIDTQAIIDQAATAAREADDERRIYARVGAVRKGQAPAPLTTGEANVLRRWLSDALDTYQRRLEERLDTVTP
jgi:hypothetical protein